MNARNNDADPAGGGTAPTVEATTVRVSSPASTGGAGTTFEQHVGAYWLAQLLVGAIPPIAIDTTVEEVSFQTKRLGWHTDDFLVVCRSGGMSRTLPGQVKLSFTVSASDQKCVQAVTDFWKDFNASHFSKDHDRFALVTLRGTNTLLKHFVGLLDCARAARGGVEFEQRLATEGFISTKAVRYCGELQKIIGDVEGELVTAADIWPFLRALHVLSLDLHSSTRQTEAQIRSMLAITATDGDPVASASASWNELIVEASTAMGASRSLCRDDLPAATRARHGVIGTNERRVLQALDDTEPVPRATRSTLGDNLHLPVKPETQVTDLIRRTKRAAAVVTQTWARKTKGHRLVDPTAVMLDPVSAGPAALLSLQRIDDELSRSGRVVLEGPAGRGKTTALVQLARRARSKGTPFMVDLPRWISSGRPILEFIARMPQFQAEDLTANDLAQLQPAEPFLFLLNGWNEISESNSGQAVDALKELDRDFPSAGIIVATRTHHLTPLPGALRLRLRRLSRAQRAGYLEARLGASGDQLIARIAADLSLDELTRTPFILSEVASLFEAGLEIPPTKIDILTQVVRLQEQRKEHVNGLQGSPLFGRQTDYLKALASEMTRRGAVELPEADARFVVADVARELANRGQIGPAGAPTILATLTAHHLLERVVYPQPAFRFDHQQIQEYFAAIDLHTQLLDLPRDDNNAIGCFTADYVNDPAWAEPLRMIAATFDESGDDASGDNGHAGAGAKLVEMALTVDLVFAGELARLCGAAVWLEVRTVVGNRFRAVHAMRDGNFQHYAVAAMLATGMDDFSDVIGPLLSGKGQQSRLRTYELWPDIRVTSLGPNWRDEVHGWSDAAQADFVSELLRQRIDREVVAFAIEAGSIAVKVAAVTGLMWWHRSDDALTRVLASLDAQTFEHVARKNADLMPTAFRPRVVAALRKSLKASTDQTIRLRTALRLVELGETDLDGVIKEAVTALPGLDMPDLSWGYIEPALKHLHSTDPAWTSEWVAIQIAEGVLYGPEHWMLFATIIPDHVVEECLTRLETEDLEYRRSKGMTAVVAAGADSKQAARVFGALRRISQRVEAEPDQQQAFEWRVMRQLEDLFRRLPDDVAAAGVISSVTEGDPLDIKVSARLLSTVGMAEEERLHITDGDRKARLRAYLKDSIGVVLAQDDFAGEQNAHLASAIAQVGEPEDMADLRRLIRADIERVNRGLAKRLAGESGPLVNGASTSYANWQVAAVIRLDPIGADEVLIDLLPEPEYRRATVEAMARDFLPKPGGFTHSKFRHDLMWAAREGRVLAPGDDQRRTRFVVALQSEIKRLRRQHEDARAASDLKELARALAAIDGRGSAATVLDVIALPGKWDEYTRLEAAERLLLAGVYLPAATVFARVDSFLQRTNEWMQDTDRYLLRRILALCPLVDDPAAGIAKVREVLGKRRLYGHELREIVTALGESRSDAATDLLRDLASDERTFEQLKVEFVQAIAALDRPGARELLLGFVDSDIRGIPLTDRAPHVDALVARLAALAQQSPEVAVRLQGLCDRDLLELNRHVLSRIMASLGTPDALAANLNLVDDAHPSPVPRGVWDQLESAFVEQRPYRQDSFPEAFPREARAASTRNHVRVLAPDGVFTLHAQASNTTRARLFRMALRDPKRRESAFLMLGTIEGWRLEHGRPIGEPRHPDLASGQCWPPRKRPNRS